jgi:hypothetical protein
MAAQAQALLQLMAFFRTAAGETPRPRAEGAGRITESQPPAAPAPPRLVPLPATASPARAGGNGPGVRAETADDHEFTRF